MTSTSHEFCDPKADAALLESAILRAQDIRNVEEVDALARQYSEISRGLQKNQDLISDTEQTITIRGLIYAVRSFHVARRLFIEIPPAAGPMLEIGAGWGPFAVAAALRGHAACVSDHHSERLAASRRLFEELRLPKPTGIVGDLRSARYPEVSNIALPYVLNEVLRPDASRIEDAMRLIDRFMRLLPPEGRLYVAEPGTPTCAARLQELRDRIREKWGVLGPCSSVTSSCPASGTRHWCHFTWRRPLGSVGAKIADAAQRKGHELHVSWLVLTPSLDLPPRGGLRLLQVRPERKAKLTALGCTGERLVRMSALRRNEEAHALLDACEPGSIVRDLDLDENRAELRLQGTEQFDFLKPSPQKARHI